MSDETSNPPEAEPYLTLARRGKEAWNAWRRENPDKKINFANVDFTRPENQDINFGGFEFGNGANFKGASFGDGPWIFDKESQTKLAQGGSPGGGAYFSGASFGEWANFSGASFGVWADFSRASFGTLASFSGASFGAMTNFSDVKFIGIVYFSNTKFDQNCRFVGSVFGGTAYFYYSKDKDTANEEELKKYLKDKKLENLDFSGSIFKDDIIFPVGN
jgi:uncharacterized protein YjbI with pentapeptide repeats